MIKKEANPIYVCPECAGLGNINGADCKQCAGLGVVLVLEAVGLKEKELYYWGRKLSYFKILEKRRERRIRVLLNALLFIFGLIGFLLLIKALYDLKSAGIGLADMINIKNEYTAVWWLSLLVDMYLIYRINQESKLKGKIKKKPMVKASFLEESKFDWSDLKEYKKIDISRSFDQQSLGTIEESWLSAARMQHKFLDNVHIFVALLKNSQVNMVFGRLSIDYKHLAEKIKSALTKITESGKLELSVESKKAFLEAYAQAYKQRKDKVGVTDLLYATAQVESIVKEIFYDLALSEREIGHVVEWVDLQRELIRRYHEFRFKAKFKPKHQMNRAFTAIETRNLNAISQDMTLWARVGGYAPTIGMENEVSEVFRVLEIEKTGAILVGPSGVGKKTIIEAVAQLMVKEDVPKILEDKRLVELSVSGLIAGASAVGEMEQKIIGVMDEVARSKNIVLVIEDIHHLVGVSAEGGDSMDVAEALAEQTHSRDFLVIATTTPEYYKKYIEKSSLAKILQKVIVNEPDDDQAIRVLEAKALYFEGKNHVYFSYQAIEETVKLSKRYIHEEYLPEKAIKILEEVALTVKERRGEKSVVTGEDVAEVVSNLTKIPVTQIGIDETKKLLNLEVKMHQRIIGQDEAVILVASALRRARMELRKTDKPIVSFLFLGPTGVGKTEVAKTLARIYFGSEKNMIRLDMSEYQGTDALAKLIGDARSNTGGYLTEAVRRTPFGLVLLDEVEKANLAVLNIFLQVLDDGRLTDASGKTIDFTNTIIIGTSNAGTDFVQEAIKTEMKLDEIRQTLINQELKKFFRPELLNRFDGIVVFKPLAMAEVVEIARIFMHELELQLEEKGVQLEVTEQALQELALLGFDSALGARPLRRVVQDRIEDKLAKLFLEGEISRRDKVVIKSGLEIEIVKAKEI